MFSLYMLSGAISLGLIVHCIKTGRNTIWVYVLVVLMTVVPFVGPAVYVAAEILPGLLGVVQHEQDRALDRSQEPWQARISEPILVGDEDQLVIGRHAMLLREEGAAGPTLDRELVQLEIPEGADHCIHLPREQRRREREIHIDQLDIRQGEASLLQHASEHGILETADREADLAPLQVRERLHRPGGEDHDAVERRRHQSADPHQRQPLRGLEMQLRLVGDREVRLPRGDQLRRIVGIGRGDQLHLQSGIREEAALLRDHQRTVVGVHEPVEQ